MAICKFKAVIFDLDGTLINTLEDLTDGVNYILKKNGFSERTLPEIRSFVGNGIKKLVERALPQDITENIVDTCYKEMLDYYGDHAMIKTAPYAGITELIKKLHQQGIKIAVVTNKAQNAAETIVKSFFGNSIDIVIGDNRKIPLKPAPDGVLKAISFLGFPKEETIYVGDSEVDMKTAKNADLRAIAVLWGFRDKDILVKNGAKYFASNCEEFWETINSI